MPSSIPFDPGLVLGNIVDKDKIDNLKIIAEAQKEVDNSQDKLNSSLLAKHKLDMLRQELITLQIDQEEIKKLEDQIDELDKVVAANAIDLATKSIASSAAVAAERDKAPQTQISDSVESPIDYEQSDIKLLDLSSDTMNMDVQYVRNEFNMDKSSAHSASVASTVSSQVSSFLSPSYATSISASVKAATYRQTSSHVIEGTVVITVNCSHRASRVFAPLVLDVDKSVEVWNAVHKDDKLESSDPESVYQAANAEESEDAKVIDLLSGQTSGSSFVGLVHIVQEENSTSQQSTTAVAASVSVEIEKNLFLASKSGKFGLDASYANNLKSLFSSSSLQSHCNVITMGSIPTIASNVVETTVARLAPDPKQVMEQLSAIQGANDGTVNNMGKEARNAQMGESFMELNNSYVTNAVSALGSYDNANNKVIDMNSLMTSLDDFIVKAREGGGGVPINFFLKPITKKMVAKEYLNKYFPNGKPASEAPGAPDADGGGGAGGGGGGGGAGGGGEN